MITEKKFTRRHSFNRLIEYLNTFDDPYYFRGQSNAEWFLESSYLRLAKKYMKDHSFISKKSQIEFGKEYVLDDLVGRLHLLTDEIIEKDDPFSKLSFLQHFGAHTHIIDFTLSPFIALYFSLSVDSKSKFSAIYAINAMNLIEINEITEKQMLRNIEKKDNKLIEKIPPKFSDNYFDDLVRFYNYHCKNSKNEKLQLLNFLKPKKLNPRIQIQQGIFMIPTDIETDVEAVLNKLYSKSPNDVMKIIFPSEWSTKLYNYLGKHNINGETLFPGLEGYIRAKKEDIIFNDFD
jgi:hypothetical protein